LSNLYHHTHGGASSGGVEVTDFSVNISPLFPPLGPLVMEERDLIAYPSIDGGGIRDFYVERFALEPGSVLGTNGAAEGIYLLPRALGLRHVLVPAPSFFEYERACRIAGAEVSVVELKEENGFAMPEFQELVDRVENVDAFFAANPNNPTGTRLAPAVVLALASRFPDKWFLVDEAFIQFTADFPSNSLMREVLAFRNVVVVHSLTKFYALPGLRLGAVIAHPDVIGRLLEHKEPWTVNAVAERVAGRLSGCLEWEESVRQLAGLERERIWRECASIECMSLFGGVANFFLARWDGSLDHLLARLKEQGMPVRDCRNFRGLEGEWFRFAVRWPEENSRLIAALREASDD